MSHVTLPRTTWQPISWTNKLTTSGNGSGLCKKSNVYTCMVSGWSKKEMTRTKYRVSRKKGKASYTWRPFNDLTAGQFHEWWSGNASGLCKKRMYVLTMKQMTSLPKDQDQIPEAQRDNMVHSVFLMELQVAQLATAISESHICWLLVKCLGAV